MILPENLMNLIRQGEGLTVEFKKSTTDITKDVYDTVCSFSNRDGGHIFFGVKDNGTILGVDKDCVEQMKKNFVTTINNESKMYPPLYLTPEEYEIDGRIVLYVYVPVGKTVYRNAGRIFDRNNESDIDITDNADMVFNLYARKQSTYFVNKVYPAIPVSSLRHDLMDRARRMARVNTERHLWVDMTDEEMLRSCGLILEDPETNKEGITLAAVLLFGTNNRIMSVYLSISQTLFSECPMLIVMMFCIFGAIASFIQGEFGIGIFGLVIGFLFSSYGISMVGVTVIAFVELINDKN